MKLLFENWRKFLTEDEDATGAMPSHLDSKVKTQADKDALDKMGYLVLKELGRGKFGVVYLVENKQSQQRLAAKVVKESDRETSNYQFAMDNKASMPEEYGKYLPEIYEIAPGPKGYNIILMEELVPLDPQVAQELFAVSTEKVDQETPESKKREKIFRNPEALAELAGEAIFANRILQQMNVGFTRLRKIRMTARKAATKTSHQDVDSLVKTISSAVYEMVEEFENYSPAIKSSFEDNLKETVEYYLEKQIVPVHQPEPSEEYIETWTSGGLEDTKALFPEAERLARAMKYFMQDKNWRPKDVHWKNVMARPSTKDMVIVDLGLFERGLFLERDYQRESDRIKSYNKQRHRLLGGGGNMHTGGGGVKTSLPTTRSDGNQLGQLPGQPARPAQPPSKRHNKGNK